MSDVVYERAMEQAFRLLARRSRSIGELRDKLAEKGVAASIIDRVIARLSELGYLNDQSYAQNYAASRLNVKAQGRARLKRALSFKKLANETIDRALEEVYSQQDEAELCQQALEKYLRIHGEPQDRKASQKLFAHLIRLGFPYDIVIDKVRQINHRDTEIS